MEEQKNDHYRTLKSILIIVLTISLGIFAINQFIQFKYRYQLLQSPCGLCIDVNPKASQCVTSCFAPRVDNIKIDIPNLTIVNPSIGNEGVT